MNPRTSRGPFDHLQWLAVLLVSENGCHGNLFISTNRLFITHSNLLLVNHHRPSFYLFLFRAFRGGNSPPPPPSFEFPPQTRTNFICFLDIFHIFSPHKINFPPKTTSLEKTLHRPKLVQPNVCIGQQNVVLLLLPESWVVRLLTYACWMQPPYWVCSHERGCFFFCPDNA